MFAFCAKRSIQETLLLIGSGITFWFIFPFAIYRLSKGDFYLGVFDTIISLVLVGIFVQSWYSIKVKYMDYMLVTFFMSAALGVIYLNTSEMIFWAYPSIIATYYLLKSHYAAIINCLFIGLVISMSLTTGTVQMVFYSSLALVGVFGLIFSIRSEKQNQLLSKLVSEDSLTKVKNRRSFDEKLEEILLLNKRVETPVCLLLLDLDFFKKINDTYGHKQGDKVLFDFAQRVKSMIRTTDFMYRFGGEEFAIIATHSELKNVISFAETIRETVEYTPSLSKYNLTVSIGVSEISKEDDADSWFKRTDLALYQSKSKGRNRVHLAKQNKLGKVVLIKPPTQQKVDDESHLKMQKPNQILKPNESLEQKNTYILKQAQNETLNNVQ